MSDVPPKPKTDLVRDHLANERTFLAWVRTAIALLGFGVLLARFGMMFADAPGGALPSIHRHSVLLGLVFSAASLVTLAFATLGYFRTRRMIESEDYQALGWTLAVFAGMIGLVGFASVVYLLLLTPH